MPQIHSISQKQIDTHIGEAPVFDATKDERSQVIAWMLWSAKYNLLKALASDQEARGRGEDPDEGR